MLAVDEIRNHAALDGAGTIERVQRAEIFDAVGLIAAQDVLHAGRFKLKDAAGEAGAEDFLVGLRVIERKVFEDDFFAAIFFDELQRLFDDGQRGEAEEVHLQQSELFEAEHVVLRHDFLFVRDVERNQFAAAGLKR